MLLKVLLKKSYDILNRQLACRGAKVEERAKYLTAAREERWRATGGTLG
jgi:hypothetical protein